MSIDFYKSEQLPPMQKINLLPPGNITSKKIDSFPPMKTPKLQDLNKEIVAYPNLKTINYKKSPLVKPKEKKTIKEKTNRKKEKKYVIKLKKLENKKNKGYNCNDERKKYKYIAFILIKSLMLCSIIYYILSSIIKH